MRKAQKKQAENFTALLRSAHVEIKKALEAGNAALAMDLLEQCQGGVIELGEMIESEEGDGFVTVGCVESYCEQLYQTYEQVRMISGVNVHKVYKALNKSLVQLENSIRNDIKVRIEVVFLPYKASMWDSLESVWKAADEDPDCDAYVIPIPYFDRDSEGNFAEMHDESGLYPDYVPITRYDAYDFAGRRPDVIFIHNPYDNNNYVTSVHPAFYSDKLKQYTDKLVYISYFILGNVDLENEEAIKGMAHFVTTPAVVNADKVIVQSENMRQAYIQVMVMVTGENTRRYWEEKILGLGSPKIDKVMATRKEDVEVPEEWLKVIEKKDGSWKKIIFYNTSVSALLNHNEKMMTKIKDVLGVFKENQENVALLWRPHPLIEATIKSVRPRLWEEYKKIVDAYKSGGWGIYDDTADMNRAVALSDAYYGDPSSVAQLCRAAGVPVMYQNVEILSNIEIDLNCADIVKYKNSLFILTRDTQYLFEYCLLTKKMELCGAVKNESEEFYISMALCNQIIYIAPYEGNSICTYDIRKREFQHIPLETSKNGLLKKHFKLCFSYQDKVYLLGGKGSTMLCIDSVTNKVKEVTEWIFDYKREYNSDVAVYTHRNVCIVNGCFWVAIRGNNVLLEYNMNTGDYCFWNVGKKEIQYVTVTFDGDSFWLSGDKRFLVKWKKETNKIIEYHDFPQYFEYGNKKIGWCELFSCGYIWNEDIYFLPLNSNMLIKFDRNSEKMKCITKIDINHICFTVKAINKDEMYVEEIDINSFLRADSYNVLKNDECEKSFLKFGIYDKVRKNYLENENKITNEKYSASLPFFFYSLKNDRKKLEKHQIEIGNKIIKSVIR